MGESFLNGRVVLHPGDCLDVLAQLEECSVDSCVTDPPYHLTSIVKRFGAEGAAPAQFGSDGRYARASAGFMGKVWDGGDVAFRPETWRAVYRVLKPGAHLVACGGTRTFHRLACAIEDAGFEIRDTISWLYGSGFPKSHDVSKGIDRAAGAEREVVGRHVQSINQRNTNTAVNHAMQWQHDLTAPATDAARQWEGWGTALKPACELIVLARKPLSEGTVAANVLRWGTGAINVDGCRVGTDGGTKGCDAGPSNGILGDGLNGSFGKPVPGLGRWPANVAHDGSDEVVAAFPDADAHSSEYKSSAGKGMGFFNDGAPKTNEGYRDFGDTGSAARFFFQAKQDIHCGLCGLPYTIEPCNANSAESDLTTANIQTESSVHNAAPDSQSLKNEDKSIRSNDCASNAASHSSQCHPPEADFAQENAQDWPLSRIVQNVKSAASLCSLCATDTARVLAELRLVRSVELVRFKDFTRGRNAPILIQHLVLYAAGRESTDIILTIPSLKQLFGSVFHAIETNIAVSERNDGQAPERSKRFWYASKADQDSRLGSSHPTVKPLDLMQWLVRLVTPKGGTVLDPFAGTGTTGEAAFREGMRAVLIEAEPEYQADIRRRMALVLAGPDERSRESVKAKNLPRDDGPLFADRSDAWAEMWAKPFDFSQEPKGNPG